MSEKETDKYCLVDLSADVVNTHETKEELIIYSLKVRVKVQRYFTAKKDEWEEDLPIDQVRKDVIKQEVRINAVKGLAREIENIRNNFVFDDTHEYVKVLHRIKK